MAQIRILQKNLLWHYFMHSLPISAVSTLACWQKYTFKEKKNKIMQNSQKRLMQNMYQRRPKGNPVKICQYLHHEVISDNRGPFTIDKNHTAKHHIWKLKLNWVRLEIIFPWRRQKKYSMNSELLELSWNKKNGHISKTTHYIWFRQRLYLLDYQMKFKIGIYSWQHEITIIVL